MLPLLVVLLTTASVPEHLSLSAPTARAPQGSARLLLAQGSSGESANAERMRELTREVEDLNLRLRAINVNPPLGSVVMAYAGYILAPMLLIGLPVLLVGLAAVTPYTGALIGVGAGLTVVGTGGVVLLVSGIVSSISATEAARAEREELIRQRGQLEDELRELKRARQESSLQPWRDGRAEAFLPVAALSF